MTLYIPKLMLHEENAFCQTRTAILHDCWLSGHDDVMVVVWLVIN